MMIKRIIPAIAMCQIIFTLGVSYGQNITQTIRGNVVDQDSRSPIIGANITVTNITPITGASSGTDGEFVIKNVPVGRVNLKITSVGYEDAYLSNVLVTSSKEVFLRIQMKESIIQMEELVINGKEVNGNLQNEMAFISARSFSVEETKRYAGSFNDPARMVSAYAGVSQIGTGNNDIIVRGNSPKGIQWRLEGIEIPNPNHFSEEGSTGGPINALNSIMLDNSDFFTGAFSAEYGDVLSGIFDMKLRKGNNQKGEYAFSLGALGTEISAEGPIKKGGKASYLLNYRYSTLSLLDQIGVVDFGGVPKYQDLSFNVFIPAGKSVFSIFGLGGISNIQEEETEDDDENLILEKGKYKSEMGVLGVNHTYFFNENTFLESILSVAENGSGYEEQSLNNEQSFHNTWDMKMRKYNVSYAATLNSKISSRHKIQVGTKYHVRFFDFFAKEYDRQFDGMVYRQNEKGNAGQIQGFINWKYRITPDITLLGGVHSMTTTLNDHYSIEPRFSIDWQIDPIQNLSFGFGQHARMESLPTYLGIETESDGSVHQYNKNMDFLKARHYVLGYSRKFTPNLMMKLETYYQDLYNIPVENDPNSSFSLLNLNDWYSSRELVNKGTGKNYGIELTIERYFANNYYFLVTGSLYESKYKAMDGIERDTYFNGNYVGNILVGKEFIISDNSRSKKILGINSKFSLIGGKRGTPIDLEKSIESGSTEWIESEAFSIRYDDIVALNLAVDYRINKPRVSHVIKLDLQNVTNNSALIERYFFHGKIRDARQLEFLPNVQYTFEF